MPLWVFSTCDCSGEATSWYFLKKKYKKIKNWFEEISSHTKWKSMVVKILMLDCVVLFSLWLIYLLFPHMSHTHIYHPQSSINDVGLLRSTSTPNHNTSLSNFELMHLVNFAHKLDMRLIRLECVLRSSNFF